MTISSSARDFRFPDFRGINGPLTWSQGNSMTIDFGVVLPASACTTAATAGLVAGQMYYINFRNWSPDLQAISCFYGKRQPKALLTVRV